MKNVNFENVQELLDRGNKPKEVFDYVEADFSDGYALVELNGKWNFINKNGNLLSDEWFDNVGDFYEGFAWVKLNDKYNFIDVKGKLLSPNQWFDDCWNFNDGFAYVKLNGKCNFIDENGKILSPNQWFDDCWSFQEGFAKVRLNGKPNYIDENGNLYDKNKASLEQQKDKETIENKKRIYVVLSDKEYIDCFDNPYDAMVCVVQKQNTGIIEVVEKIF